VSGVGNEMRRGRKSRSMLLEIFKKLQDKSGTGKGRASLTCSKEIIDARNKRILKRSLETKTNQKRRKKRLMNWRPHVNRILN
jgi:hypothetical protein